MTAPLHAPVRRALLSVSDKAGIVEFARELAKRGVELLSTGGTYKLLRESGLAAIEVSSHTGFPEIMDGRVKTLHPKIHGGLLGRRDVDSDVMQQHGIRSEEHTSELQSLMRISSAVFCLQKKKKT